MRTEVCIYIEDGIVALREVYSSIQGRENP